MLFRSCSPLPEQEASLTHTVLTPEICSPLPEQEASLTHTVLTPEICSPLPEQEASLTHTVLTPPGLDGADGVNVRVLCYFIYRNSVIQKSL